MNRGFLLATLTLFSVPAMAHVSDAQGSAHAAEHLWLALAVMPAYWVARPLVRKLLRIRRR